MAITVINWNNYVDTAECLESVKDQHYPRLHTFVIDNNSDDGSGKRLQNNFPWAEFLYNERNFGFSGGHNTAIRRCLERKFDYVLVLNNDAILPEERVVQKLVRQMEANQDLGVLSPLITEFPRVKRTWFKKGVINWPSGRTKHHHGYTNEDVLLASDYVPFCTVMIRGSVLKDIGLLPEDYFLYYEDVDFCYRARQAGYDIATHPSIEAWHKDSRSTGSGYDALGSYYSIRNQILFVKKADRTGFLFYVALLYLILTRVLYRLASGHKKGAVGYLQGVIDGLLGRSGKGVYP